MLDIADPCDQCGTVTKDLTPLGKRELCPQCYRESIADLDLLPRAEQNARDDTLWEP